MVGKLENIFAVIIHALFAVAYLTIFQVRNHLQLLRLIWCQVSGVSNAFVVHANPDG